MSDLRSVAVAFS